MKLLPLLLFLPQLLFGQIFIYGEEYKIIGKYRNKVDVSLEIYKDSTFYWHRRMDKYFKKELEKGGEFCGTGAYLYSEDASGWVSEEDGEFKFVGLKVCFQLDFEATNDNDISHKSVEVNSLDRLSPLKPKGYKFSKNGKLNPFMPSFMTEKSYEDLLNLEIWVDNFIYRMGIASKPANSLVIKPFTEPAICHFPAATPEVKRTGEDTYTLSMPFVGEVILKRIR